MARTTPTSAFLLPSSTPQYQLSVGAHAMGAPLLRPATSKAGSAAQSPGQGGPGTFTAAALAAAVGALAAVRGTRKPSGQSSKSASRRVSVAALPWPFAPTKKTVVITGASSGLGLAATKQLALSGDWLVIMACRDFQKAECAAKEANLPEDSYKVLHCDLSANNSVRQFVGAFRSLGVPLDCLVCNAAVYFPNAHKGGAFLPGLFPGGGPRWSADGHELSFAANYLGHFLLCNMLLEDLQKSSVKPARCVILGTVTASINNKELGGMVLPLADVGNFEGLEKGMKAPMAMVDGGEFDGAKAYKDSKVCDVMLMRELHRRYHEKTGIVFTSLYPGCIAETNLFREHYPLFRALFPAFHQNVTRAYVSEDEAGARLAAVVSDQDYVTSGSYYSWSGKSGTGGSGGTEAKRNKEKKHDFFMNYGSFRTLGYDEIGGDAGDEGRCKKLFDLSKQLVEQDA